MKSFSTKSKVLAAMCLAALPVGASVPAYAQEQTPPDTDVRALEVPNDVTGRQLRDEGVAPVYQGRSIFVAPRQAAPYQGQPDDQ